MRVLRAGRGVFCSWNECVCSTGRHRARDKAQSTDRIW